MSRRVRLLVVVAAVLFALGASAIVWVVLLLDRPQTISETTSPDGTWSVAIVAKPQILGGYDICVEVRDAEGRNVGGGFAIDLTDDLRMAQTRHAISFIDNNTAKVGKHTVQKPSSIPTR